MGVDLKHSLSDVSVAVGACTRVRVNPAACQQLADLLRRVEIPPDREETSLPHFSRPLAGNFFLALVAICHQTSPRGRAPLEGSVGGKRLRGWDYLSARLEAAARSDGSLLTPRRWTTLSESEVRSLFHDAETGDRLSEPALRAALLRDLGERLCALGWEYADDLHRACGGRIATGEPNLLNVLATYRAYGDPVRKKSVFFLALMQNSGLWQYEDPQELGPPVDYHEVRGHLRLGTVEVADPSLLRKLHDEVAVTAEEDVAIRRAVYDAIMHVARLTGATPSQLHYMFWNLFRSVCTRTEPQCFGLSEPSRLPPRYANLLFMHGEPRCPFAVLCGSAGDKEPVREHVFETDYY